jgi:NADPH2:quinone reductase
MMDEISDSGKGANVAQAWLVRRFGEPADVLERGQVEIRAPEAGEVVVGVDAVGLNFLDVSVCRGGYTSQPDLPIVPGAELVGRIVAVGPGVDSLPVGERVAAMSPSAQGAFAAEIVVPATAAHPVPDEMPDRHAAGILVTYQTAYFALVRRAALREGEWLLVHAGAGGVGTAAIQLARAVGARVIATAGSREKVAVCREQGAELAVDYRTDDFVAAVHEVTSGAGVDVVFDPVGGELFERSLECAAFEARLLPIGWASGTPPALDAPALLGRNLTVIGVAWGSAYPLLRPNLVADAHRALLDFYEQGLIQPVVPRLWAFDRLPEAVQALGDGSVVGKAVVAGFAPTDDES